MPIMVGTITVWVMPSASMRFITPPGSKAGMVTILEPDAGITSKLAIEAAWNSGV